MTTVDPFLRAHELTGGHIYDIATGLRPTSVRDQSTRARLLIRRALQYGIIRSHGDPLVISGAGIAGAIAALEAVKYQVRVILVEKRRVPFGLQHRCLTRTIDPNLYQWPAHRWDAMIFPTNPGDHVPLWFRTDERPHDIAHRWKATLERVAREHGKYLDARYGVTIEDLSHELQASRTHRVTFSTGESVDAAMVLYAQGPGSEKSSLSKTDTFRGYRFWDTDPFDADPIAARRLLIVGSGDGALQDFIRVLLRPNTDLRRLLLACNLPGDLLTKVLTLHQHNTATFLWCGDFQDEHKNDSYVHQQYVDMVQELNDGPQGSRILSVVKGALRSDLRRRNVVLAHPCGHFTHGFPLNRFLAILIARATHDLGLSSVDIREHTFVRSITCKHPMRRSARRRGSCYPGRHRVTFAQGECYDNPESLRTEGKDEFDGIILRLGLEKLNVPFVRDREKPLRQILPDHLAHES